MNTFLKYILIILALILIFLIVVLIFMHLKYQDSADAWGNFFQFLYDITHWG